MLAKANLKQIEEVTSQEIPPSRDGAEANPQFESAQNLVLEVKLVQACFQRPSERGLVGHRATVEQIDSESSSDERAVKQRKQSAGVEVGINLNRC